MKKKTTYSESNKNDMSMNMSMNMNINEKEKVLKDSKKAKKPMITEEMKEQNEKMVDLQFEEAYNKFNNECK